MKDKKKTQIESVIIKFKKVKNSMGFFEYQRIKKKRKKKNAKTKN